MTTGNGGSRDILITVASQTRRSRKKYWHGGCIGVTLTNLGYGTTNTDVRHALRHCYNTKPEADAALATLACKHGTPRMFSVHFWSNGQAPKVRKKDGTVVFIGMVEQRKALWQAIRCLEWQRWSWCQLRFWLAVMRWRACSSRRYLP